MAFVGQLGGYKTCRNPQTNATYSVPESHPCPPGTSVYDPYTGQGGSSYFDDTRERLMRCQAERFGSSACREVGKVCGVLDSGFYDHPSCVWYRANFPESLSVESPARQGVHWMVWVLLAAAFWYFFIRKSKK